MNSTLEAKHTSPKLVLALDTDSFYKAKNFVNRLYPKIKIFKVGPQAFMACGLKIIEFISSKGAGVFLDLKFFDIPNTVANAVRLAVRLKVRMLTMHISGGESMVKAAVSAAEEEAQRLRVKKPLLIGVTVLTSQEAAKAEVLKLARQGLDWGLDGVVCSVREAVYLKKAINAKFYIVTPGIRPGRESNDDQKRTSTVKEAIAAGSDFLVVGRPILEAQKPLLAAEEYYKAVK